MDLTASLLRLYGGRRPWGASAHRKSVVLPRREKKLKSLYLDRARASALPVFGPRVTHSRLDVVVEYATRFPVTGCHLAGSRPPRQNNIRQPLSSASNERAGWAKRARIGWRIDAIDDRFLRARIRRAKCRPLEPRRRVPRVPAAQCVKRGAGPIDVLGLRRPDLTGSGWTPLSLES